ncbi:C40 family peptidase [Phosphitispora sp. TUW77]|uniref:C40 family peptidase n=1 Tax=Phosphitispora sp. TUW77 TaxID=3152361 RepID=UPI003AB109B5
MRQRIASAFAVVIIITAAWLMSSHVQESFVVVESELVTKKTYNEMVIPVAMKDESVLSNAYSPNQIQSFATDQVTKSVVNISLAEQASIKKTEVRKVISEQPKAEKPPVPQPSVDTAESNPPQPSPLPVNEAEQEPKEPSSRSSSGQTKIEKIISIAHSLEGTPYVRGGSTPKGFDCSGFTSYIFRLGAGISLPRTSSGQASIGKAVSKAELKPGDIVYFNTNGKTISHVGIYVGNNSFIHASYTKGITVTSLSNSYYVPRYLGARRVL